MKNNTQPIITHSKSKKTSEPAGILLGITGIEYTKFAGFNYMVFINVW